MFKLLKNSSWKFEAKYFLGEELLSTVIDSFEFKTWNPGFYYSIKCKKFLNLYLFVFILNGFVIDEFLFVSIWNGNLFIFI